MALNLMLHCGAHKVDRLQVLEAQTPEPTNSHFPIPHSVLLQEVEEMLGGHNFAIKGEAHALSHEGNRYFGLLELESQWESVDYSVVLGLRNSHDKSFSSGIAAGSGVFVCDNLAFSGEIKLSRKHTRYILRDLPHMTHRAVSKLYNYYADQEKQVNAYKGATLTNDRARALMVEGVKRGVLGCTQLPKVLEQWETPDHEEFNTPTVWKFFNAVTEVAKQWTLDQKFKRTQLLHGLCNAEVGIAA